MITAPPTTASAVGIKAPDSGNLGTGIGVSVATGAVVGIRVGLSVGADACNVGVAFIVGCGGMVGAVVGPIAKSPPTATSTRHNCSGSVVLPVLSPIIN